MNDKKRHLYDPENREEAYNLTKQYLFSKVMVDPDQSRSVSRILQFDAWQREDLNDLISHAKDDFIAHKALKEIVIDYIEKGEPLPKKLGAYVVEYLKTGKEPKKYRHKVDMLIRNVYISLAVKNLKDQSFWPTGRYDDSEPNSIYDIVAQVATELILPEREINHDTVRKIWYEYENKIIDLSIWNKL